MYKIISNRETILSYALKNFGKDTYEHRSAASLPTEGLAEFPAHWTNNWTNNTTKKYGRHVFASKKKAQHAASEILHSAKIDGFKAPMAIVEKTA